MREINAYLNKINDIAESLQSSLQTASREVNYKIFNVLTKTKRTYRAILANSAWTASGCRSLKINLSYLHVFHMRCINIYYFLIPVI